MRKELLANFLGVKVEDLVEAICDEKNLQYKDGSEYLVLTDEESDELFCDMELELFNDIGLDMFTPEAKRHILNNFINWDEVLQYIKEKDGRGSMIASYDGIENKYEGYFIYRMN